MTSRTRRQNKFKANFNPMFQTEAEKNFQKLIQYLEPLRENQVQIDSFTTSDLYRYKLSPAQMIKHVRVLTTIPHKEVRDSVLSKAHSLGICPFSHEMNLFHIDEVCHWMKTKPGIEALVEVQCSEKLKRRRRSSSESALIKAFNAQFAEYSFELKKARALYEKERDYIRQKYWPVSVFDVDNDTIHGEDVIEFCKKEDVKFGLYKYVDGLMERKVDAVLEAENLDDVINDIGCFEDVMSVFDQGEETSYKYKNKRSRF